MSGDMLTIEQVEQVINKVLDERALASQISLQEYARKTDVNEAIKKIEGTSERVKGVEKRVATIEENFGATRTSLDGIKEEVRRTFDIAQSTNNLALRMAEVSQQNRTRIDDIDKAQDEIRKEFSESMKNFTTVLNDIEIRSSQTVEQSKRMDEQVKTVIKMAQETQRMMSEFLMHSTQEQAKNEPLLAYVAKRKQFEETVGENIKSLLTVFFKDKLRMGVTIFIGSLTVGGTLVEIVKALIGG